jgi:hypothetical protein
MSPLGHWAYGHLSMIMPYPRFGAGPTPRARRPRPSEKIASRVISGHLTFNPPRQANASPRSARPSPSEGRAPHARDDGITSTELPSPSGHRPLANSSIIDRRASACVSGPYHPGAETAPLRENHPSPTPLWQRNPFGTPTSWPSCSGNPITN